MKLKEQTALVTGAGRGIGRAIALSLASEGAHVILVARSSRDLEGVAEEIAIAGGSARAYRADMRNDGEVRGLFAMVTKDHGRLSILVNNAGIGRFGRLAELSLEDLDAMWTLNVRAIFLATKLALPLMRQNGGTIVQVASLAAKNAFVGGSGYAATKWALLGLSRCLMLEEREHRIRVVTVCPGSVDTTFSSSHKNAGRLDKILAPQDVADAVLTALLLPSRAMMSEIDLRPTTP
jgi:3-oxoacyl-[acyl-carrier protein] reductase